MDVIGSTAPWAGPEIASAFEVEGPEATIAGASKFPALRSRVRLRVKI